MSRPAETPAEAYRHAVEIVRRLSPRFVPQIIAEAGLGHLITGPIEDAAEAIEREAALAEGREVFLRRATGGAR